jgi:muramoyltetrapeptide carboxypeptidase
MPLMIRRPRAQRFALMLSILTAIALTTTGCQMLPVWATRPIKPAPLEPGDTIMFIAPAGELSEKRMTLAKQRLEEMGFVVKQADDLFRQWGYLAGTDERRAEELMDAFTDPDVDAIFPGTGGYGTTRMLDLLDYRAIRQNPKVFIGFSDITGLHLAINRKAGLVTFHTPNPMWGLGSEDNLTDFSATYFWRTLLKSSYYDEDGNRLSEGWTFEYPEEVPAPQTLAVGKARGRLIGGNFSLVAPTMGTPYEIQTKGKILFIEDVREAPYRIDRYLSNLKLAGKLDDLNGVILGKFTRTQKEDEDPSEFSMREVFEHYFADLGIPVIYDFPAGHYKYNATLPFGAMVELEATEEGCRITVLEDPVKLED